MKTALITGVTGQDGAYLAKLLRGKGYRVVGAQRRSSTQNLWRLRDLGIFDLEMVPFELLEESNIRRTLERVKPQEVYNLAAQSFVGVSFEQPLYTADVNAMGAARILEAIREVNPAIRFYQASTSEMFGASPAPQDESTPFHPRSPYGVSKLFAHWSTVNYREAFAIHASTGILFNHESPLRGSEFVTRKITQGLADYVECNGPPIALGNLDAQRDWGFAGDYVEGMWRMVQATAPDDYVLATGETHTVREFCTLAAAALGIEIEWSGKGKDEIGKNTKTGLLVFCCDEQFYRPAEVDVLMGNPMKAAERLSWVATTSFPTLVGQMVGADLHRAQRVRLIAA